VAFSQKSVVRGLACFSAPVDQFGLTCTPFDRDQENIVRKRGLPVGPLEEGNPLAASLVGEIAPGHQWNEAHKRPGEIPRATPRWFTDIVADGLPTFSAEADSLIAEVASSSAEPRPAALISAVDGYLERIGYDELASRSSTVGLEYRNLLPEEQLALERNLRELCDPLRDTA
jgi:hypothetical protein